MDCREFEARFKAREIPLEALSPSGLSCNKCWDSGMVWVDCDGIPAWAYCRCYSGKQKSISGFWALPIYDYEMESLFKLKPFPAKAFIPSSFSSFKIGLENKMAAFKKNIEMSEKFWMQK